MARRGAQTTVMDKFFVRSASPLVLKLRLRSPLSRDGGPGSVSPLIIASIRCTCRYPSSHCCATFLLDVPPSSLPHARARIRGLAHCSTATPHRRGCEARVPWHGGLASTSTGHSAGADLRAACAHNGIDFSRVK